MLFGRRWKVSVQERLRTDAPSTRIAVLWPRLRDTSLFFGLAQELASVL